MPTLSPVVSTTHTALRRPKTMQGDVVANDDDGTYFFFSAPASPVHYILRSPPASSSPYLADADCCGAATGAAGDFEFAAHGAGTTHGGPAGTKGGGGVAMMSSAEELFVAGRIRVGCLSPIRQEDDDDREDCGGDEDEERDGRSPRATRRARSVSPTRSPRGTAAAPSDALASASVSSSSSSSSSAKNTRRRMSLRDLLSHTGGDCAGADQQESSGAEATSSRLGFWPPSIWPSSSRSSKKSSPDSPLPCPATPQPGRRRSTSDRGAAVATTTAKRAAPGGGSARRTTSLPYRQGLVLGCLGFGPRGYGLASSMHPLPSR